MTVYDAQTGEKITKRHRFTSLKIRRGSLVDNPAQEPAKVVLLMKRRDAALTELANGGDAAVLAALRKNKDLLAALAASAAGDGATTGESMSNANTGGADPNAALNTKIVELEKSLARANALASMNDAQRAHLAVLKGADADAFVAATPEARATIVEAAKAADAVVYKAKDGTEYRRSDDPRLIAMAKREDVREAVLAKERDDAQLVALKARAKSELTHMPGEEATKVALLKAVDGIVDETLRGKVFESIKATDAGLAEAFKRAGANGAPAGGAEAQLDAMAKKRASEKGITFEQAYAQVTKEPEGRPLYEQLMGELEAAVR